MPILKDEQEALRLLSDAEEELAPDRAGREKAADALMQKVVALNGHSGFATKKDIHGGVWLILPRVAQAKIVRDDRGNFKVYSEKGQSLAVELVYNSVTHCLEAPEPDTFMQAMAGTPPRRRSALAALVEASVRLIKEQRAEQE